MRNNPHRERTDSSDTAKANRSGLTFTEGIVVLCILAILVAFLLPNVRSARGAARRTQCKNNLKQIGIALDNYHEKYQAFPPAYTVDANGRPLHSWRTLLLPFLDAKPLYESIDLTKPWDDPKNAAAFKQARFSLSCAGAERPADFTTYMAVVGPDAWFRPTDSRSVSEITDGMAHTLMVIEVAPEDAVHWMTPTDTDGRFVLAFGSDSKCAHTGGTHGLFADGRVRFITSNEPIADRRAMITVAGNDGPAKEVNPAAAQ